MINLTNLFLSSTSFVKYSTNIAGHWHDTLTKLGIEPFQDIIHPDALPFSRPETNLRFDLHKRKHAFKMPGKSSLFFTNDAPQQTLTPAQQRHMLERELQAFKKIYNDYKKAESAKERMLRKQQH
jgi:hypothetical protein